MNWKLYLEMAAVTTVTLAVIFRVPAIRSIVVDM